jgi:hypothetical protein
MSDPSKKRRTTEPEGYKPHETLEHLQTRDPVLLRNARATVLQFVLQFFDRQSIVHYYRLENEIRANLKELGNPWWRNRLMQDCPSAVARFLLRHPEFTWLTPNGDVLIPYNTIQDQYFFIDLYIGNACSARSTLSLDGDLFGGLLIDGNVAFVSGFSNRGTIYQKPTLMPKIREVVSVTAGVNGVAVLLLENGSAVLVYLDLPIHAFDVNVPQQLHLFFQRPNAIRFISAKIAQRSNYIYGWDVFLLGVDGRIYTSNIPSNDRLAETVPVRLFSTPDVFIEEIFTIVNNFEIWALVGLDKNGKPHCIPQNEGDARREEFLKCQRLMPDFGAKLVSKIVTYYDGYMALLGDGTLRTWGENPEFLNAARLIPQLRPNTWFVDISSSNYHTIFRVNTGEIIDAALSEENTNIPGPVIPSGRRVVQMVSNEDNSLYMLDDRTIIETVDTGGSPFNVPPNFLFVLPEEY